MTLPAEIQAELRRRQAELEAAGLDKPLARQKVWQDYQAEVASSRPHPDPPPEGEGEEIEPPELPPPKGNCAPSPPGRGLGEGGRGSYQQDLTRSGNKPFYQPRADSGDGWLTPERKAKSCAPLAELKQRLGI